MYGEKYIEQVITWRRDIHSHPELSQHEERTSELAASVLEGLGLEVKRNIGGYGVVGLLRGKHEGKTIALRADMDALPLNEETGLSYASLNPGVMHACGHDTHTAMLLGAACALSEMKDNLNGNVKFIFQPAEELNPTGGAPGMLLDGVLDNPNVDAMLALHVWPAYETGKIVTRSGALMAASDRIFITVHGKTAHGSRPDQGVDAIVATANIITG
ncbi:MAG: amidohydrolase, partial [Synergistaceae bacterium]|nr:amidohydrolase [Synergistaceae bacterium]